MSLIEFLTANGGKTEEYTWAELAEKHDIPSADAARKSWKRYQRNLALQHPKIEEVAFEEIEGPDGWKAPEGFVITKARSVTRAGKDSPTWLYTIERKGGVVDDFDLDERMGQIIKEYIPTGFKKIPNQYTGDSEDTVLLFIADCHVGAALDENSLYDDQYYDGDVFRRRLQYLAQDLISRSVASGGLDFLVVFDLGDALDGYNGQTTRGGHNLPQNLDNAGQFDTYVQGYLDFFKTLFENNVASKYSYIGMSNSNHSGDWDYVAMKAMASILEAKFDDVECTVSRKFIEPFSFDFDNGKTITYLATHGKDAKYMKKGLPIKLDDRSKRWIEQYIRLNGLEEDEVVFVKGDLHQYGVELSETFDYINVPSLFGSSDYLTYNFGVNHPGVYLEHIDRNANRMTKFIRLNNVN